MSCATIGGGFVMLIGALLAGLVGVKRARSAGYQAGLRAQREATERASAQAAERLKAAVREAENKTAKVEAELEQERRDLTTEVVTEERHAAAVARIQELIRQAGGEP